MSNKTIGPTGLSYLWSKIKSIFATKAEIDDIIDVIEENEEVVASALNDLNSRIENMVVEETDPTVPDWAKNPDPPSPYEIGALDAYSYVDGVGFNNGTTINHYTTCSTSASTTAKTASKANFQLSTGAEIIVKFTYTNTASNPTLNINSTGAKSIYYNGTNIPASALSANRVYKFVYDGSYYQLVGTLGATKTSELTNDAGFLTSSDVTNQVGEIDSPVLSSAVYEYITEDERVIASALNDLNTRLDAAGGVKSITLNSQNYTPDSEGDVDLGVVATLEINHGTSDTTFTLTPNVMHIWGTVSSLTLSLPTDTNEVLDEYMFTFTSGSTPTTLSLPSTVKWVQDIEVEANKTYQVSIINNLAGWLTNGMPSGGGSGGGGENNVIESISVNGVTQTVQSKNVDLLFKTINNNAITGTGNITIQGGGSGEENVIEIVKVNGSALTPDANKAVDVTVPTESTVSGWGFTKNAGTITGVTGSNGLTGSGTSGSVTISHAAPSTSPAKSTSAVYPITIDQYGHITAAGTAVTIPAAPGTLNTNNTTAQTASSSEALSGTINLHKVAKTGTYSDLIGTPTIPTVNNSTITVQMNGSTVDSFTTNTSSAKTINLGTVITSHQTLKTINSTSLTGSGNIQINGLPSVTTSDNGKVLSVSSGAWTATTPVAIYSGTSAPSSSTGNNGDIYVQYS